MRVSTSGSYLAGVTAMQRLQFALDFTQRQISSGRRILTPADDPIAAARSLQLRESLARLEQFDRNAGIAQNRLALEETGLTSVNDILQRVRELTLQANNASQSDESRGLIAIEMREHLDNLLQLANQRDASGHYVFAGNLADVKPVSRIGTAYTYDGDQGQRQIQISENRQLPDGHSGDDVFFRIRTGNGIFSVEAPATNGGTGVVGASNLIDPLLWDQSQYTVQFLDSTNYDVLDSGGGVVATGTYSSGDQIAFQGIDISLTGVPLAGDEFNISPSAHQDIFTTVDRLATAIEQFANNDVTHAKMANSVNAELLNLDQAIGNVLNVRTQVGARLAAIENQVDNNSAHVLTIQETLGTLEDLDYAEALSRLSIEATTLEAAQQSFIRTQQLSLFSFF